MDAEPLPLPSGPLAGSAAGSRAVAAPPTVSWPDPSAPAPPVVMNCPNCSGRNCAAPDAAPTPKALLLTVHFATPDHPLRHSRVLCCAECGCLFYENQTPPDYTEGAMLGRGRVAFYLQQGAGLSLITRPLARVRKPQGSRYLEVGCGFGFGVDFAIHARQWRASGIDPGQIAALGAARLGVPIEQRYLGAAEPQWDGVCDVVMASETLEHVPSPAAFIATLRRALRQDGVLILTTPAGEHLHPGQSQGLLVPLLSPGLHLVFQTRQSLLRLLREAGFRHVELELDGSSLVAYAADAPLDLVADRAAERLLYRRYLARRAAMVPDDTDLFLGLMGRALQEAVNDEAMAEADAAAAALGAACRPRFGLDLETLEALPDEAARCSLERLADLMPLNLGGILYADTIRRLAAGADRAALGRRFDLAADAADAMRRALGELAMEDGMSEAIAWAARAEALLCDAASGRPDVTERLQLLPPPPPAPSMAAGAGATDAAARRLAIAERALVGAVNATHYGLGREIAAASGFDRIDPADPGQEPMTVTRRDLLFCLGVLELQPGGDPARALALMQRVRMLMQPGEGQDDVADLFWAALRGELHAMLRIDGAEAAEAHHRGLLAGVAMASAPWDLRLGDLRLGDLRLRDPVL